MIKSENIYTYEELIKKITILRDRGISYFVDEYTDFDDSLHLTYYCLMWED